MGQREEGVRWIRGHAQAPNAEGSSHPTETEEQTMKGGVQGDTSRGAGGEGASTRGRDEVIVGDSGTTSNRLIDKLGGGDSASKNTT